MELEQSSLPSALEETTALVRRVYKMVWQNFYTWEQDHCRRTLHSLARVPSLSRIDTGIESSGSSSHYSSITATSISTTSEDESFTVHDYTQDPHKVSTVSVETINVVPHFKGCPPYEMCTPVSRNVHVGDDFEDMPFLPLADDPTFDHLLHAADYPRFEWQLPIRDPDCKSC
jgi:hypothetical protein